MWFQHECRLLDALVYVNRTNQRKAATHQKPTRWSRTGETSSRKQAVAFQQEGPLTSLWMRTPRLNLHPRTSVSPSPSQDRTVNAERGEALPSRVDPFSRCDCVPRGRPSSHQRHVREPVSAWWAALPGDHPDDSHCPDPRDANRLGTTTRHTTQEGAPLSTQALCFRRDLSEFIHSRFTSGQLTEFLTPSQAAFCRPT